EDITELDSVCLDIDLDFFSCIQDPMEEKLTIEISKDEYVRFVDSPYHRIRFLEIGRVDAVKLENKFFLVLNGFTFRERSPLEVDEETILSRIDKAVNVLVTRKIKPQIITICRSRFSGYTPAGQWQFLE